MIPKKNFGFYTFFILLLISINAVGQEIRHFHHLTTSQNLSSGKYNNYIHQDQFGYVWISSTAGLNRYDGLKVKQYRADINDDNSLISNLSAQSRFAERPNGDLFFATEIGFSRYNRATDDFSHFHFKSSNGKDIRNSYLWCKMSNKGEDLFVSGGRMLYWVNAEDPEEFVFLDSLFVYHKSRLIEVNNEYLLAHPQPEGSQILLNRYNLSSKEVERDTVNSMWNLPIADLQILNEDRLVIATSQGVHAWLVEESIWRILPGTEKLDVIEIEIFSTSELVLATREGHLYKYDADNGALSQFLHNSGSGVEAFQTNIERITISKDKVLWVSTVSSSVYFTDLNQPALEYLRFGKSENQQDVLGIAALEDGHLLVLYTDHVLELFASGEQIIHALPVDGTGYDEPASLYHESGKIWVGTYSDMYYKELTEELFHKLPPISSLDYPYPPGFHYPRRLPNGRLLLPTNAVGGYLYDEISQQFSPWLAGVQRIRFVEFDEFQRGVVSCFTDTLHFVSYGQDERIRKDTSFVGLGLVNGLQYDRQRRLFWVGSSSGLLKAFHDGKGTWHIERINERELQEATISSLLLDDYGQLWITTSQGIISYNPESSKLQTLALADGVQAMDFNLYVATKGDNGTLYFGGAYGINALNKPYFGVAENRERIGIADIKIDGDDNIYREYLTGITIRRPDLVEELTIPYGKRDITFSVATFDYHSPSTTKIEYAFSRSGIETRFRPVDDDGSIDIFDPEPGSYLLTIKGVDSKGRAYDPERQISITILPPWYRTWWAYTLYALTIASIAFAFFWIRLQGIRKLEKAQLKTAISEARVAETEARAAKTETSVLRLQMNPHFIFNSLNAVNAFLWKGNKLEANEYLARFALLMRETLNRSTQTLSRLEDTIYSLENYLETEQMRLGDKMSYKFEVDETLDTFSVYFPTMMLQPFVENAIWHGISGMEGQGLITIRFQPDRGRGVLIAEVEDNGRGRKKAAKRNTGHASKSLGITQRRLDLLNMALNAASVTSTAPAPRRPENNNEESPPAEACTRPIAEMKIIDLLREDGSAGGTLVRLTLPLKYPMTYARDNS